MGIMGGAIGAGAASQGMGQVGLGIQGVGAATSAVSAYYSAKSQQSSLNYQAGIEDINAQQSELAAQQQLMNGNTQVAQLTQRAGQVKSVQRANIGANGIALDSANASETLASTDITKTQDMDITTANAVRAAWGYRTQETNQSNDALVKSAGAGSIDPALSSATSLLGSAGQVANSWYMLNKVGG